MRRFELYNALLLLLLIVLLLLLQYTISINHAGQAASHSQPDEHSWLRRLSTEGLQQIRQIYSILTMVIWLTHGVIHWLFLNEIAETVRDFVFGFAIVDETKTMRCIGCAQNRLKFELSWRK